MKWTFCNICAPEKTEAHRVTTEWHIACVSSVALICDCQVNCPWISFLLESEHLCAHKVAFCTLSIKYDHSPQTVLKHSEQAGRMGFEDDVVESDPQQIKKNPIDWDFRILEALCPALCHRFFIRLLPIVTLVYGFDVSSRNVTHAVQLLWQMAATISTWCCIHSNTPALAWGPQARRNFIISFQTKILIQ